MRKPIIVGNWKMNKTRAEAAVLADELKALVGGVKEVDIAVAVPYTDIDRVKKSLRGSKIRVGVQNVAWADSGAFTGEVSAAMLVEAGVEYVIIGHSERRQYFGETDESVNKRVRQALKYGLKPIVCVGETENENLQGLTGLVIERQIEADLEGIDRKDLSKIVIAYEPIWAIGTGRTPTAEQANETIAAIRREVSKLPQGTKAVAAKMRIQYGGSMNAKNAAELMAQSDIDGGLIGGASLKSADFAAIIEAAKNSVAGGEKA